MAGPDLPTLGQPAERKDAARSRRKVLDAAERILRTEGLSALTMNRLAAAAGVGVGTVYRRFKDPAGLAWALLEERERELQQAMISGPPPLGPGAPPARRIKAFLSAYVDLLDYAPELMAMAERSEPADLYSAGAYAVHRRHLEHLLAAARPDLDAQYLAAVLLAPLAANLFRYHRTAAGMSTGRIKDALGHLVDALIGSDPPRRR